MKLNIRITLILTVISVMTIFLLTALMHFRYHVTRFNLINEHLNVTIEGVAKTISNSEKLGIKLEFLKNVNELIQRAKKQEDIIESIEVLTIKNGKLQVLFKKNTSGISDEILTLAMQKIKATKGINWSFSHENGMSYVGLTIRDSAGIDQSCVMISYNTSLIYAQEKDEISNLYKRMFIALFFSIAISFFITFKRTKDLTKMVNVINASFKKLENEETTFDLGGIYEPSVRGNFRSMLNAVSKVRHDFFGINTLLDSAENETKSRNSEDENSNT